MHKIICSKQHVRMTRHPEFKHGISCKRRPKT